MSTFETRNYPLPVIAVERRGNHVYATADGIHVMQAYAETARREVNRLTQELAEAVAVAELLDDERAGEPTPEQILDLIVSGDFGTGTVREYLSDLLGLVWDEKAGFDGKRPWGNSGWEWELYQSMIDAGFLAADPSYDDSRQLDEDGRRKADDLIAQAIKALGKGAEA